MHIAGTCPSFKVRLPCHDSRHHQHTINHRENTLHILTPPPLHPTHPPPSLPLFVTHYRGHIFLTNSLIEYALKFISFKRYQPSSILLLYRYFILVLFFFLLFFKRYQITRFYVNTYLLEIGITLGMISFVFFFFFVKEERKT